MTYLRTCVVCGTRLTPKEPDKMVAHEYYCYKTKPHLVPPEHQLQFGETLAWEARSFRAKAAVHKRKANQGNAGTSGIIRSPKQ